MSIQRKDLLLSKFGKYFFIHKHPWIAGDKKSISNTQLTSVTEKLREFNARRKFRKAQMMVLAATRFKNIIKHYEWEFYISNKIINDLFKYPYNTYLFKV